MGFETYVLPLPLALEAIQCPERNLARLSLQFASTLNIPSVLLYFEEITTLTTVILSTSGTGGKHISDIIWQGMASFFARNSHVKILEPRHFRMPVNPNICWVVLTHLTNISRLVAIDTSVLALLDIMAEGSRRLLPHLRELILEGVDRFPAHLYVDAIQSRLIPELDSWLLEEDAVQLETLPLCNIRLLDDDTRGAITNIVNSVRPLPDPKVFSLIFDGNDDDSGSEVF